MEDKIELTPKEKVLTSKTVSEHADSTDKAETHNATPLHVAEQYNGNIVLWTQILLCAVAIGIVCGLRATGNPAYGVVRAALRSEINTSGWYTGGEERKFLQFTQKSIASVRETAQEVLSKIRGESIDKTTTRQALVHRKGVAVPYGYSAESYRLGKKLCFPLINHRILINSGYGGRVDPIKGTTTEFHGGIDLAASTGDMVCASRDGVVRFAGAHKSYGNYVRIIHPGGTETIYAHMQYLFVRSGQRVLAGETIGSVGQTGAATGPHLHFEILYRGVRYDPTEAVEKAI